METIAMKVLIIDEDNVYVDTVEAKIKGSEPHLLISKAYSGTEGLSKVKAQKPDLIICDIDLPDLDGHDICHTIKNDENLSYIPIIVTTTTGSKSDHNLKVNLLEAGAEAFLSKPFQDSELIAYIRALLRLKKAEDQVHRERDLLKNEIIKKDFDINKHKERLTVILDQIIEGIWDWDFMANKIYISDKCKQMLGYKNNELTEESVDYFMGFIHPDDKDTFLERVDKHLNHKYPEFKTEVRVKCRDGSYRWFLFKGHALRDGKGEPTNLLGILSDVTEKKEIIHSLEKIALYDYVTKLPNRTLFYDLAEKEIQQSARENKKVGFVFLDLDNFKKVNDDYGHDYGDSLLAAIADRLLQDLRPLDIVARFAGDEFLISLPGIDHYGQVEPIIERLKILISKPIPIEDKLINIGFSAGYSIYPDDGDNLEHLIKVADERMYEDKKKNKVKPRTGNQSSHTATYID